MPHDDLPMLSELEGAILSEIHHRGRQTAFKVRRSFATSPSLEWRGSAGSVYAAIGRLERAGLIESEVQQDRRGGRLLTLSEAGRRAMQGWACDATRAASVGVDPFRLRSGIWAGLPEDERGRLVETLRRTLAADIEQLKAYRRHDDAIERASLELAIRLQESRLDWLSQVSPPR